MVFQLRARLESLALKTSAIHSNSQKCHLRQLHLLLLMVQFFALKLPQPLIDPGKWSYVSIKLQIREALEIHSACIMQHWSLTSQILCWC